MTAAQMLEKNVRVGHSVPQSASHCASDMQLGRACDILQVDDAAGVPERVIKIGRTFVRRSGDSLDFHRFSSLPNIHDTGAFLHGRSQDGQVDNAPPGWLTNVGGTVRLMPKTARAAYEGSDLRVSEENPAEGGA